LGTIAGLKFLTTEPSAEESLRKQRLLDAYVEAVLQAPSTLGLTSKADRANFRDRHVADAVSLLETLNSVLSVQPQYVADVGTGNGVPGLVFGICQPNWRVVLIDSDNKKCGFLDTFVKSEGIENVRVQVGRAEYLAHGELRESFDLVSARALGQLPTALELVAGFVAKGGRAIVPHGTIWEKEVERSQNAVIALSLLFKRAIPYGSEKRHFVMLEFEKISPLSERYPRSNGIPLKRPL
jgi:16S rRNA (guanine527-N7)-methyltransferase